MKICNKPYLTAMSHESDDSEEEVVGFDKVDMVYDENRTNNSNIARLKEVDRLYSNNDGKFEFVSKRNPNLKVCNNTSLDTILLMTRDLLRRYVKPGRPFQQQSERN